VQSKHNLQLADANKIPLWRNWMQPLLTFEEPLLIFAISFGSVFIAVFCVIKLAFINNGAKLRRLFNLIYSPVWTMLDKA
jgi:hypothetical protein